MAAPAAAPTSVAFSAMPASAASASPGSSPAPLGLWARLFSCLLAWLRALPCIPLPFLGLGVYRAWLNVLFDRDLLESPGGLFISQNAFDIVLLAALLLCAFGARHISPLHQQRWARPLCGVLLVCSTLFGYGAVWTGAAVPVAAWLATVLGGIGTALVILLWSELYGGLAPVRICLYYAASLVAGAAIGWMYQGFMPAWRPVMTALLPVVSLMCLNNCYRCGLAAPGGDDGWASFSFPWKPVLVIAVYAFAYGLLQTSIAGVARPNVAPGTVLCALFIVVVIALVHDRAFNAVYGMLLPCMTALFLVLAVVPGWDVWLRNFCANWGYTASQVFIMTMLGSICYHWGVNALWLFGIERAVRLVAQIAGRTVEGTLTAVGVSVVPLLVVVVLVATFVAFRKGRLGSAWGVELEKVQKDPGRSQGIAARNSLVRACALLSKERGLSQREEEVLLLLAQRKTARDIERELCVANGTAKAHIRHVYQKLDIHTREELFDMVDGARAGL